MFLDEAVRTGVLGKGRIRRVEGMNKTEALWADNLALLKRGSEIEWFMFEAVTFKLAKDTRYTPDFAVMLPDGLMQFHEVKGFWREDAKVKIKVAAAMFPFEFIAIKRENGEWKREKF